VGTVKSRLFLALIVGAFLGKAWADPRLPLKDFVNSGKPSGPVHLWDLASAPLGSYSRIFELSETPAPSELRGRHFNGLILLVEEERFGKFLFTQYTGGLRGNLALAAGMMYARALTFQKAFLDRDNEKGESGINYWPLLGKSSMPMRIYSSLALLGVAGQSLKIDYDLSTNLALIQKPLIDEIRRVPGSDLYLGKMYYRVAGHPVLFLWFALEKAD
jgi:hypothetical protein